MSLEIPVRQISQSSFNNTSTIKTLYNFIFTWYYLKCRQCVRPYTPPTPDAVGGLTALPPSSKMSVITKKVYFLTGSDWFWFLSSLPVFPSALWMIPVASYLLPLSGLCLWNISYSRCGFFSDLQFHLSSGPELHLSPWRRRPSLWFVPLVRK